VTEKEKREDEALKNCIQEAYGLSDEQLLAELEEIEASLSDDEFVGAEERIYNRIKERENERTSVSSEIAASSETPTSEPTPIRKISKKKKWLIVGLAAALAVGAGVTTIGENNYFLKRDESKPSIVLDSGKNVVKVGALEEAYEKVENELGIPVLKLNYIPSGMKFAGLSIANNSAVISFVYKDNVIYLVQEQKTKEISLGIESDRIKNRDIITNEWLSKDIYIEENTISDGRIEYSALIYENEVNYRIIGILPKEEFTNILLKLSY